MTTGIAPLLEPADVVYGQATRETVQVRQRSARTSQPTGTSAHGALIYGTVWYQQPRVLPLRDPAVSHSLISAACAKRERRRQRNLQAHEHV